MKKWMLILALLAPRPAGAYDLRLDNQRISLKAEREDIRSILGGFSAAGVAVKLDPQIKAVVSVSIEDEEIPEAFEELLSPWSYVLVWNVVQTPMGELPLLSEVRVHKPGRKDQVKDLKTIRSLQISTGPNGEKFVDGELLLSVRSGMTLEAFRHLLHQIGGTVVESIPELGVYRVRFVFGTNIPALVEQLRLNAGVHTAEPNYITEVPSPVFRELLSAAAPDPAAAPPPAGAPALAILDSGLMDISGLNAAVRGTYDAVNPSSRIGDSQGHGTQMALIASGAVLPGGVNAEADAAGVPLVAIRAFNDDGVATEFSLLRSIAYAAEQGARVINMSWGSETSSSFMANAMAYAQSKGIILVAAAGNTPTGRPVYPAAYEGVIAVGAVTGSGERWPQSNHGDFVSLAAPGTADMPVGHEGPAGSYAGTSISSAFVSRALSLYLGKNPECSNADAVAALMASLRDAGEAGRDRFYGNGVLDSAALSSFLGQGCR